MFKEGNLLYFKPFYFKNGSAPKNKYFLVLKNIEGKLLLASLPTSQDHIPTDVSICSGICEFADRGLSAYIFIAGQEIATEPKTMQRFAFQKNTFIYGEQIDTYPISIFLSQMESGKLSVHIAAILDSEIIEEIKNFIQSSCTVKGKFKKMLNR